MKKIPLALLIALSATLFTNGATAQNQPLACQDEAAAGLKWENGRWVTRSFTTEKFILVRTGNTLTTDSAAKFFEVDSRFVTCGNLGDQIQCADKFGSSLYLYTRTLTGGIAKLFGSTNQGNERDTVSVRVFSCTPF